MSKETVSELAERLYREWYEDTERRYEIYMKNKL